MMLVIRKDETSEGVPPFVVELHKKSYQPRDNYSRKAVMDDEHAMDVIRYRADSGQILAIAREVIKHLDQEHLNALVEKRLYALWESKGLSIPWGCRVEINSDTHRLVRPEKTP